MNEKLMFKMLRKLSMKNAKALDKIAKKCNIRQDLVLDMFIELLQTIRDNIKKGGTFNG